MLEAKLHKSFHMYVSSHTATSPIEKKKTGAYNLSIFRVYAECMQSTETIVHKKDTGKKGVANVCFNAFFKKSCCKTATILQTRVHKIKARDWKI